MKKAFLASVVALAPSAVLAHSGEHTEGVFSSMLHSITNIDHLWVALPAAVVITLSLRKVLRAQKK